MSESAKSWQNSNDSEGGTHQATRFRALALRYQEIAAAEGVRLTPFRGPDMPLFSKATPQARKTATDFLESIVAVHEETLAATENPINTRQLLWRALRRLSLVPGPEVFDHIANDDVVIIYNDQQTAVFWNLQFFNYSSLTVEEMFFGLWYEFTRRAPEIQAKLYEMAMNLISGKITGTFVPGVPAHEVEEVGTLECMKTMMELPHGSVLTKDGKLGGILIVQRMRVIE